MKTIALCSALAFGALTSTALAQNQNANQDPGYGIDTATETQHYAYHHGYPGSPQYSQSSGHVGTNNGSDQSNQSVGSGRATQH